MPWTFSQAQDIGTRAEQQDRIGVFSAESGDRHLLVLADGMGGHRGGAEAAQKVVDVAREAFYRGFPLKPRALLERVCIDAHRAIAAGRLGFERSPGSTCLLLYLEEAAAYWAHVGDSRLYHMRRGEVLRRTIDHSVDGAAADRGGMSAGGGRPLYMRLGGREKPEPEFGSCLVEYGDTLLLCSDGLWDVVDPEKIAQRLRGIPAGTDAADLVRMARKQAGVSCDNISAVVSRWLGHKWIWGRGVGTLRRRIRDLLSGDSSKS